MDHSDEVLDSIIRGTNQNGASDDKFTQIAEGEAGRQELKIFICILIIRGIKKVSIDTIYDPRITVGAPHVCCWMPPERFSAIKRHICFNAYDGDIDHPYEKFNDGIDKIRDKSLALFSNVFIYALDEMRIVSKSKRNKNKT